MYTNVDRLVTIVIILLPMLGFCMGIRISNRAYFRRYEQGRLAYTRNRLRNL